MTKQSAIIILKFSASIIVGDTLVVQPPFIFGHQHFKVHVFILNLQLIYKFIVSVRILTLFEIYIVLLLL